MSRSIVQPSGPLIVLLCAGLVLLPCDLRAGDSAKPGREAQRAAPAAILQLRVVDGDGEIYAAGSRATRGVTVEVTDETGKPVENATVSFQLPESGPGGVFATGSRTEIAATRADGRASVWGMRWNRTPGAFQIRITAVKDQVRAGAISSQYLSESAAPAAGISGGGFEVHHSHKWLYIGLAVAGAAGAGLAVGRSHSSTAASSGAAAATGLSIGAPSIVIGGPQ
ncbi:MAG: hypothetical protein ACRD9L_26855 [Bryobacteraceae bacterium]